MKPLTCSMTMSLLNGSHGNGNQQMQWDLIAVESGNYVDKLVDMTGSIIALSFITFLLNKSHH